MGTSLATAALVDPVLVVPTSADPTKAATPSAGPTSAAPQPGHPAPPAPDSAAPAANSVVPGAPAEEEGWRDTWEEVWEDDQIGDLVLHQSSRLDHACKKCDKQLDNENRFRQHMKVHMRKGVELLQCHYCDFMTNDEVVFMSNVGDTHTPKFHCGACGETFTDVKKRLEHVMIMHAFNYGEKNKLEEYECFDCGETVNSKQDLMSHKTEKHYKTRMCTYFHGNMSTCRFPAQQCINIHNEKIHPTAAPENDYRSRIPCKHGDSYLFRKRPSGCFYKHASNVETEPNIWQQRGTAITNTQTGPGNVQHVDMNQRPGGNSPDISPGDMNLIVLNMSRQMESIVQKLQVSDFPNLEGSQRKN